VKGVVFTEFIDMVEARFTPEVADRMITAAAVPSDGAYTAVGTYDYHELIQLVAQLSMLTSIPRPKLVHTFGVHLFDRFVAAYPALFAGVTSAFSFLERIENHIHVEVRKLYPDAELPTFTCDTSTPGRLTLLYRSSRPFADLAEGLIAGCIAHFGEPILMHRNDIANSHETHVRFVLTMQDVSA
jgi:Haem-NO-binding